MIDYLIGWLYDFKVWWCENCRTVLFWIFGISSVFMLLKANIRVVIANTDSIPYKICLQLLKVKPQKGDLCVFKFKGQKFLKYIRGVPGDKIVVFGNHVYVDTEKIGTIKKHPHLSPLKNKVIPKGYRFMAGTHPESFDSRYKEFGLIPESDIESKAIGLVKF